MTDRGAAEVGPPVAIAAKERMVTTDVLRIGPLPEPGLFDRLRASWSLDALIPSFEPDPTMPPRKGFRIAGALALVVHAGALVAIVLFGRYAIMTFVEKPKEEYVWVAPNEFRPADNPDTPGSEPATPDGGPGGSPADGGGSNTDTKPATGGELPPTSPVPSPVPLNLPPPPTPVSLPMTATIQGPDLAVPPPAGEIGLPGAPDKPGEPSTGADGGRGVGDGRGDGGGPGTGPGSGSGPGGPGGRGPGPGGSTDGRTGGVGGPGGNGPGGGVQDRNVRMVRKSPPKIPKKMAEKGSFGTVKLRVTIGPDGSILSVIPVNTLADGGTQAAIDSIYRCRFEPAIRNGVAVTDTIIVTQNISPLTGYRE